MKLILCEKPAVAREFADALGADFADGYHKGNGYVITNAIGHLVTLFMPEDYSEALKDWNVDRLPILPKEFRLKAIDQGHILKQINIVKKAFADNDIDTVIVAGDAGREGELIARNILKFIGELDQNYTYLRFWTSKALTKSVITENIKLCKPLSDYDELFRQGEVRSHIDWLIGINYSRLFTKSFATYISFGRVQTCLLKRQYDLDNKIKNFRESKYFQNAFTVEDRYRFTYLSPIQKDEDSNEEQRSADAKKTDELLRSLTQATLTTVSRKTVAAPAPKLFDLTELQKLCNKKFGFSSKKTLETAQALYEKHKLLSYPRTPSRVLNNEDFGFFCECLQKLGIDARPDPANKNIFNSSQVEDHHALLILDKADNLNLSEDERKVYSLVLDRMKLVLQDDYIFEQITSEIPVGEAVFRNHSKIVKQKGWKAFCDDDDKENEDDQDSQTLDGFSLREGGSYPIQNPEIREMKTKPAQYDSESSLLAWMKKYNLGTPATRSGIIEILFDPKRGYCTREKNKILITEKGSALIRTLLQNEKVKPLLDKENTKNFEEAILKNPQTLIPDFLSLFKEVKEYFQTHPFSVAATQKTYICPVCAQPMKYGRFGCYCPGKDGQKCLSVPNEFCGAKISEDDLKKLLSGEKSSVKNMKSKAGKTFRGRLSLDLKEKKIKIDFA